MQPDARHDELAAQRELMVAEQLVARGIRAENVLDAMRRVPRERFMRRGRRRSLIATRPSPSNASRPFRSRTWSRA